MLRLLRAILTLAIGFCRSRRDLLLENLALRQQLTVLKQRRPQPRFGACDRTLWVMLRCLWSAWKEALILIQPGTVVRWHRVGFKAYRAWLSRHRTHAGRKRVSTELREFIFRMVAENPTSEQLTLAQTRGNEYQALVSLYKALGGGWKQ